MATIVEKVQNLISGIAAVKAAFKTALTDKGVTVADELKLKDYPPLINDIQVESGEEIIAELNIVTTEEEPTNPVEGLIWIYETGAPDTLEPDIGGNEGDNSDSGGGSGSDNTSKAMYRVSNAGSTEANGDYFDTGETRTLQNLGTFPIYKNSNDIYLYFSNWCSYSAAPGWVLAPKINGILQDDGSGLLYCTFSGSDYESYMTAMLSNWSTLDGVSPTPVCRKLDENGNEIIPADYTVSGAGTEAVNGDYYATGNYISGTSGAIYKHKTNEVYLFGDGSNCNFAFEPIRGSAYYYTCETYSYDIQTGDWANAIYPSTGSGSTPYPTVTKN